MWTMLQSMKHFGAGLALSIACATVAAPQSHAGTALPAPLGRTVLGCTTAITRESTLHAQELNQRVGLFDMQASFLVHRNACRSSLNPIFILAQSDVGVCDPEGFVAYGALASDNLQRIDELVAGAVLSIQRSGYPAHVRAQAIQAVQGHAAQVRAEMLNRVPAAVTDLIIIYNETRPQLRNC